MARLIGALWRVGLIAGGAVAAGTLATRLGAWLGLGLWAGIMALACAIGMLLMRLSPVGRIGWQNRAAAYVIPWGYKLGRGKLGPISAAAWLIWVVIGAAAIFLWGRAPTPPTAILAPAPPPVSHPVQATLLFIVWMLYGAIIVRQLGLVLNEFRNSATNRWLMLKLMAALLGLTTASAIYWMNGRTVMALVVAGGPVMVLGGGYALFLGVILTVGRRARWN